MDIRISVRYTTHNGPSQLKVELISKEKKRMCSLKSTKLDNSAGTFARKDHQVDDSFLIGELGNAVKMTPKTIRFYEKVGLIKPDRIGRLRVYHSSDVTRLETVKFLRRIGASIREIKSLGDKISEITESENRLPEVDALLQVHLDELKAKRKEISELIDELQLCLPDHVPDKMNSA